MNYNLYHSHAQDKPFSIYDITLSSRLLLGTAQYPTLAVLQQAIEQAKPGMITVSLRRNNAQYNGKTSNPFWTLLKSLNLPILPNTAGCHSVKEALTVAQMSREVFGTNLIKLEITGDEYNLQPDPFQLPEASEQLTKLGFKVLPYCTDDLVLAKHLVDAGCEVLMPWGSPIGTGKGLLNPYALHTLRERLPEVTLLVDAGLGTPSDAAQAMELGYDGILLNSAVANAGNPVLMAQAFANAVTAGRQGYLAQPMQQNSVAVPSTPVVGVPFWHQESQ